MFTYFIKGTTTGLIKIGRGKNPANRLMTIKTGATEPLELLGALEGNREREIHDRFSPSRSHGEWFTPSDDLAAFILANFDWSWVRDMAIGEFGGEWIDARSLPMLVSRVEIEDCEHDRGDSEAADECERCNLIGALHTLSREPNVAGCLWREEDMMLCAFYLRPAFETLAAEKLSWLVEGCFDNLDMAGISFNAISYTDGREWRDEDAFAVRYGPRRKKKARV